MRGQRTHEILPRIAPQLQFNKKSLVCSYSKEGHHAPALLMWNYPLHRSWKYFEVEIIDGAKACEISIGLTHATYSLSRHVGLDSNSLGYHAVNGNLYHASGAGQDFGSSCTIGDIMGCGIDYDSSISQGMAQVYFTKNGERIRDCIEINIAKGGLFPSFALNSQGEKVRLVLNPNSQSDEDEDVVMADPNQLLPEFPYGWARVNTGIYFDENGSFIEHLGGSRGQDGLSLIQWSQPITRSFNSFKLEIIHVVEAIAIGLASPAYPFDQFPGWQNKSIAYHSDDGRCFHGTGWGNLYGPSCTSGDTMSLWVNFNYFEEGEERKSEKPDSHIQSMKELPLFGDEYDDESLSDSSSNEGTIYEKQEISVVFYKNGQRLESVKTTIPEEGYFPTIGLMKNGEKIKVNMQPYSG
ncbi:SPRY domain-containing protein 3-like [Oopsacas minuta]|uniref:SPRY domain-containing protein 3-like n=1 Tax=Oopsacas minuta TaxID=111878 RepID=A0AAV7JXV8_9METZ|nr:SPRY domain-containing protein 3-like [Oopsacas minuta]